MARPTKRETVVKKRAAKTKALKKGKELVTTRKSSSKYAKIQKNNIEVLRQLKEGK